MRHFRSNIQILASIQHNEGWRGFYRGLGTSLAGIVPAASVKFWVYGNSKRLGAHILGRNKDDAIVHAAAAVAAGVATATATNPIWVVKTRLQLEKSATGALADRRYKNSIDCARQVLQKEGMGGLYRGLSASYLGSVETVLHLVLYEQLKLRFSQALKGLNTKNEKASELAHWISTGGAAGSAKLIAVLATYPHEVCRLSPVSVVLADDPRL